MKITGGPETAAALRELANISSNATALNAIKRGMVKASAPMLAAAIANAPKDHGDLATKDIVASQTLSRRQKKSERKNKDVVRSYVGERSGSTVGLLSEFGTDERFHKDAIGASGKSVGRIPMHPWMRPAFESTARAVLNGFAPVIGQEVEKAAIRARKKHAKKAGK